MKKTIIIILFLVAVFVFRDRLIGFTMAFFSKEDNQQDWMLSSRNEVYDQLPILGFDRSLPLLEEFENRLQAELENYQGLEPKERVDKRYTICELAVVYKKTAILYFENGTYEKYLEFIKKSQDRLVECANLQNVEIN